MITSFLARLPAFFAAASTLLLVRGQPLQLHTDQLEVSLDLRGRLTSLIDRSSATNFLAPGEPAPLLQIRAASGYCLPESMNWQQEADHVKLTLRFDKGSVTAVVRGECKPTHVTFELEDLSPADAAELVLWGPYPSTIGTVIGETIGVVRNPQFALGIQALNSKTIGGFPNTDDDVMPMYDLFAGADLRDVAPEHRDKDLFRGDTAKPTAFGSVLQAFCRDRRQERVIRNWGHVRYTAPAFDDGGAVGTRIALFGCPPGEALERIGEIEVAEGLPHICTMAGRFGPGGIST